MENGKAFEMFPVLNYQWKTSVTKLFGFIVSDLKKCH